MPVNEFGQPIGDLVPHWRPVKCPERVALQGDSVSLRPLSDHGMVASFARTIEDTGELAGPIWTYVRTGPFSSYAELIDYLQTISESNDPLHYVVIENHSGRVVGSLALLRHDPSNGVIEVGWVTFTPAMQRTVGSTEAQFLLMRYVFDELGYRRYEWKCDDKNEPSIQAAKRLGFSYEGTSRNAVVYKGRNRDTAWFSITREEWQVVKEGFEAWLSAENFDEQGRQISSLAVLRGGKTKRDTVQ